MDNKIPEVEKFISQAAHEIKGPLTTIHLYAEALLTGNVGKLTREQKEYVEEIHTASKKMVATINRLRGKEEQ